MKRRNPVDKNIPAPLTSVTAEEVKLFLKGPTKPRRGPTKERFILDFTERSGAASPWNKRAAQIFTLEFLESHPDARNSGALVKKAFQTHVFHLKNKFIGYLRYVELSSSAGNQAALVLSNENAIHISRMSRRR